MPPKISKKPLWALCEFCQVNIPSKDLKVHLEANCDKSKTDYISNGCLCGSLEFSNLDDTVSKISSSKFVFITPSTGNLCQFVIGEPLILRKDGLPPIARLMWPSKSSPLSSVILPFEGLDAKWTKLTDRHVFVEKLNETVKEATSIEIISDDIPQNVDVEDLLNLMKQQFLDTYLQCKNILPFCYFGKQFHFSIENLKPEQLSTDKIWYRLTSQTKWAIPKLKVKKISNIKLEGVESILKELTNFIKIALERNNSSLNKIQPITGVLLYGHSGTGKTAMCKHLIESLPYYTVNIKGTEIFSKYLGETEKLLRKYFNEAIANQPSIIFVDEVDTICPKKFSNGTDQEKRVLSAFVSLVDSLHETENEVFLLCTTNKPDMIDSVLRRFGRLDKEIEIPVPACNARRDILKIILNGNQTNLRNSEIEEIAQLAHGFVPADLVNLCSQAALNALTRCNQNELTLVYDDFVWALSIVKPSAMREVLLEVPNVKWADIGGLDDLKLKLRQSVEWPIKHPDKFLKLGIKPPNGVLMYGPPGCSKTMIAKALASESGLNFLSIKGPELFSKWVGESEKAVRKLFDKARQVAPSIIFFDEIDALGGERTHDGGSASVHERVLAQILTELDGVVPLNNVTIVAATNRPDRMDRALLRPGRIDRIVYVPLPDAKTRSEIFKIKLRTMCVSKKVSIDELVKMTEGFSGAEIHAVCHESALKALEENIDCEEIESRHFDFVLTSFKPRTPQNLLDIYTEFSLNNR